MARGKQQDNPIQLVEYATMLGMLRGDDVGVDVIACPSCDQVHVFLGSDGEEPQYRIDMTMDYARVFAESIQRAIFEIETGMHMRDEKAGVQ